MITKTGIFSVVGRPNAGKSSILNALLGYDRAIVTNIPGTTRDTIEETLNIDGVLFRFIDTAGLRKTDEIVEKIGIERTFKKISEVVECHFVTGKHNLLIKIFCFDHDHLMQILLNTIQRIPYVQQTETQISLDQAIERQVWVKEYQNTSFSASVKKTKKEKEKE